MAEHVEFLSTRMWKIAALLLVSSAIFLSCIEAAPFTLPPTLAEIRTLPETHEAETTTARELRDYSWKHENKQRILSALANRMYESRSLQRDPESTSTLQLAQTPALMGSFPGNGHDDFDPPDPTLAVGPAHVLSAVNYTVNIFDKTGKRLLSRSLRNWFALSPDLSGSFLFDPKVIYDQYDKHYIVLCVALAPRAKKSFIFFSASRTQNPLGEWAFWELDMQRNNTVRSELYADFPGLGYDAQAIYITANMLDRPGNFRYAKIRVLKKSEVYSFQGLSWHDFFNMFDATGARAINIQPAQSFGPAPAEFLVSTNAVSGNKLTLWAIRNAAANPTLGRRAIPVSPYALPPSALQKGGGAPINTGDAGVVNVLFRGGRLYTAHSISFNWGSGPVSAARYYEIQTNGLVKQEITFGRDGLYYYYPAVMADSAGNVCLVYNRSGATEFAGIHYTGRKATDPAGVMQGGRILRNGSARYNDPVLDGLNPWGDYNGIALDPVDETFWIFSEFTASTSAWSTRIGHLRF